MKPYGFLRAGRKGNKIMKVLAEFKVCRDCKSSKRLMDSIVQKEIELGNMSKMAFGFTQIAIYCNVDPTKQLISGGRMLGSRVFKDICLGCGKEYIFRIESGHVMTSSTPGVVPTFT